ncbi:MAG: carboxymuconolactone decarboxylase family protein [Vicinamibacterales bacterium]
MGGRTKRVLVGLTAVTAYVLVLNVGTGAQATIEALGARRPLAPSKPRIAPVPQAEWSEVQRGLAAKYAADGRADNALRTLLHSPDLVDGVMPYTLYLSNESTLSPRHRELLILRVAWLCGTPSMWATHGARARSAGFTAAEIRRIAQGPDASGWDPFEATLLRLADQLFRNSSMSEATWRTLSASYDMFHLVDAVETVGHFTMLAMMYNAFGVEPDDGTVDRLPTDVPYRVVVPPREPPLAVARFTPIEGRGISVNRTFARHPKLYERWQPRQSFVVRISKLPPRQRELLTLRIGWNCQSEYEWAKHVGTVGRARDHGLDPVRIAEGPSSPVWDPFERTLLHAADELYRDTAVSDGTWRALTERLDTPLVMAAITTVSDFRTISMSLNAYGVQLEEGDEGFPKLPAK